MRRPGAHLAAIALASLAFACGPQNPVGPPPVPGEPCRDCNVILVSLDTLRADHLGAYGYERPTSPNIDAFAKTGALFERAISQATWTLPAHVSILTSLYSSRHGVRGSTESWDDTLTLADILHDAGYRTVAFTESAWMSRKRKFHTFDEFDDEGRKRKSSDSQIATSFDRMIDWLDDRHPERFFLLWHSFQTHCPYVPDPGFDRFSDPSYDGPVEIDDKCVKYYDAIVDTVDDADRRYIVGKYDGTILSADDKVGQLLDVLERRGLADRTIVVLTSDHGESFAEREVLRRIGHGMLYDEVTHVPLIVRIPGSPHTSRFSHIVETIDIMPTVLEALDLPVPEGLDGRSLFETRPQLVAFSERLHNHRRAGNEFALWSSHYLLIHYELHGRFELYDLERDPQQRTNLAGTGLPVEAEMRRRLLERVARLRAEGAHLDPPPTEPVIDEEDEAELRALGYVE